MTADIITPSARRTLDAIGNNPRGGMCEWHPVVGAPDSFIVVWSDETACQITVTPTADPGPVPDFEPSPDPDWMNP
jgi:hypothetical protein